MINTQEIQKWFLAERTNEEKASHARNVTITQVVSIIFSILTIVCASVWLGYNTHYATWQILIAGIISLIVGLLLINWARTARRLFLSTPDAEVQNANLRNTFTAFAASVIAAVVTLAASLFTIYYRCWYKVYQSKNTDWSTVDNLFPILTATLFIQFILFTYAAYGTYIAAPGERTIRRLLALSNALLGILGIVVIYYTLYASRHISLNLINNIVGQDLIDKLYWVAFIAVIASIIAIIFILRRWRTAYLIYAIILAGLLLFGATWIGLYHRQLRQQCGDYSTNCSANLQTVSSEYLANNGCPNKYKTDTDCNSNEKALQWELDVGKSGSNRANKKACINTSCCQALTNSILDPFVKLAVWGFLFTLVLALSSGSGFVLSVLPSDESVAGRVWEYACFAIQLIFIVVYFFLALFGLPAVPATNNNSNIPINAAASLGSLKVQMASDLGYAMNPMMNVRVNPSTAIQPVPQHEVGENACYPIPSVSFPTECDGGDCSKAVTRIALYSTGTFQIDNTWSQGDVVLLDEAVGKSLLSKKTPEATVDTVRTAQVGSYFTAEGPQSQLKDLVTKSLRFCPQPFRVEQAKKLRMSLEEEVECDLSEEDCEEVEVCDETADTFAECCKEFPADETCVSEELRKVGDDTPIATHAIVFGANSVTAANRPKAIIPITTDKTKAAQEAYAALSLPLNTADQYTVRGLLVVPSYYAETDAQKASNPDKNLEGKPTFDWAADLQPLTLIQADPAGKAAPKIDETRLDFCVTRRPGFIQDSLNFPLGEPAAGLVTCSVADEVTRVPKQANKELTSYEFNFKVNKFPQDLPYTLLMRVVYKNTKTNKAGPYFYQKAYINFTVGGYPKVAEQNLGVIVLNPNVTFPYTDDQIPTGRRARVASHIKNDHLRASVDYPKAGTASFPQPFARISVNVVNAANNQPIPGALVELYTSTNPLITRFPETAVTNRTNNQGSLVLPNTTQAAYLIKVTAQGFHSSVKVINAHYHRYLATFALSPLVTELSQMRVVLEWKTAVLDLDLFVTFNPGKSGEYQCEVSQYQKRCVEAVHEAGNYVGGQNGSETIFLNTIGKYDYLFFVQSAAQTNDDIFKQSRYSRVAELNNPTKNITLSGAQIRVYTAATGGATYQFEVPAGKSLYYDVTGDGQATAFAFAPKAGYPKDKTNDKLVDESKLTWLAFCMKGEIGPRSIIPLNAYWDGQTADRQTPDAGLCSKAYAATQGNPW